MTIEEFYTWHGYSSTDSLYGHCQLCFPRWEDKDPIALDPNFDLNPPIDRTEAINYELAGRQDASYSFKDFRSPTKARKRHRERNEKYYSWRDVKPGELGLPHRKPNTRTGFFYETLLADAPVEMIIKHTLYREAQCWPGPPKLHRSSRWDRSPYGSSYRHYGPKHSGNGSKTTSRRLSARV